METSERYRSVIPVISPREELLNVKPEGWNLMEDIYGVELDRICREYKLCYLCSPLRAPTRKLARLNVLRALYASAQITGAEYGGNKLAIWIPHLHGLTIYNEMQLGKREEAMKFDTYFIHRYKPLVVKAYKKVSRGMESEITFALIRGIEYVEIDKLKTEAKNIPSPEEAKEIFKCFVRTAYSLNII
jgi:hypothetical protein